MIFIIIPDDKIRVKMASANNYDPKHLMKLPGRALHEHAQVSDRVQSGSSYTIQLCRLRGTGGRIGTDGTPMSRIAVAL
jgi:hypothetical protein